MMIRTRIFIILFLLNTLYGFSIGNYTNRAQPDNLMFHLTPSVSLLEYKSIEAKSKISANVGMGVEYAHYFGQYLGLSIGAEISSFSSFYKFNGRRDSLELFDYWSSKYYKLRQNLTTKEHQRVTYLSLPVKLNFRSKLNNKLNFDISVGAAYTVYLSEKKSIVSGTVERQAFFGDIYVNIDDFRPLMFGQFTDYINPSSEKQFKSTLLGIAQMGVSFKLNDKWNMNTALNFQYGFKDIKNRSINILVPDEYSGVTATNFIGTIRPVSIGLRVGVTYVFDLFDVGCKCHGSWY